jgi:OmpA-OmpF porin, OOP family
MKRLLFGLMLLLGGLAATAQPNLQKAYTGKEKPADYGIRSAKAMKLYHSGLDALRYSVRDAQALFAAAVALEPNFAAALCAQGVTLYQLKELAAAREPLLKGTTLKPGLNLMAHVYLGYIYQTEQNYVGARDQFNLFLKTAKPGNLYNSVQNELKKVAFAAYWMEHPVPFEPKNMGAVNSAGEDVMPTLTADERMLFFASRREGSTGGFNRLWNDFDEDFYVSYRQADGTFCTSKNLGPPINTAGNEGSACISPDGQWVYFTACNREDGLGECDLYMARFNGSKWSEPKNLGPQVNGAQFDSQPYLSHDGRRLYFSSTRAGGRGGSDIWVSYWNGSQWGKPLNLGDSVNTTGDEYQPFLHADGQTLYFSSNAHLGFGGFDLFKATRRAEADARGLVEAWGTPQNLGYPLNTGAEERSIFVNAEGTRGYINTNRYQDGKGRNDLYWFQLDPRQRPRPATYVRGIVYDSLTKRPLEADVVFVNLATRDTVRRQVAEPTTGTFLLTLPLERDYAAYVDYKGYLFSSTFFRLKNDSTSAPVGNRYYDIRIPLLPIAQGSIVRLDNIFFDFDKATLKEESRVELEKLLGFLKTNPAIRIELRGHTDDRGSDEYNLKLSDARAAAVRDWLLAKGITPNRLAARGYGETQPVEPNTTDAGRARNRRTEFRVQ